MATLVMTVDSGDEGAGVDGDIFLQAGEEVQLESDHSEEGVILRDDGGKGQAWSFKK